MPSAAPASPLSTPTKPRRHAHPAASPIAATTAATRSKKCASASASAAAAVTSKHLRRPRRGRDAEETPSSPRPSVATPQRRKARRRSSLLFDTLVPSSPPSLAAARPHQRILSSTSEDDDDESIRGTDDDNNDNDNDDGSVGDDGRDEDEGGDAPRNKNKNKDRNRRKHGESGGRYVSRCERGRVADRDDEGIETASTPSKRSGNEESNLWYASPARPLPPLSTDTDITQSGNCYKRVQRGYGLPVNNTQPLVSFLADAMIRQNPHSECSTSADENTPHSSPSSDRSNPATALPNGSDATLVMATANGKVLMLSRTSSFDEAVKLQVRALNDVFSSVDQFCIEEEVKKGGASPQKPPQHPEPVPDYNRVSHTTPTQCPTLKQHEPHRHKTKAQPREQTPRKRLSTAPSETKSKKPRHNDSSTTTQHTKSPKKGKKEEDPSAGGKPKPKHAELPKPSPLKANAAPRLSPACTRPSLHISSLLSSSPRKNPPPTPLKCRNTATTATLNDHNTNTNTNPAPFTLPEPLPHLDNHNTDSNSSFPIPITPPSSPQKQQQLHQHAVTATRKPAASPSRSTHKSVLVSPHRSPKKDRPVPFPSLFGAAAPKHYSRRKMVKT
ncbi:hypothetical protein Pelo_12641 [Pelomyxa schiedti]|nr:hypothetical protein Pelo_12641 [Pelomyxa schiedti]